MKKFICFPLVLLILLGCLTACDMQKVMDEIADKAEATPKVEEMMTALAEGNTSDAKALLHPDTGEEADAAIGQMSTYLAGRTTSAIELKTINVSTSTSTSGKVRQEKLTYQVTLSDSSAIYLNVVYLSDKDGTGFSSFQMVLGVI